MLFEGLREVMSAVARPSCDEVQLAALLWLHGGHHCLAARQCDGRGWQAATRVGVIRRVGDEIARVNIAVVTLAEAVDHGGIRLQPHSLAQSADEHARNAWAL